MSYLNLVKDHGNNLTFLFNGFPEKIIGDKITAAGGAKSYTLPTDAPYYDIVFFYEAGVTIYVALNKVADIPVAGDFIAGTSVPNIQGFRAKAGDTISFITEDVSAAIRFFIFESNRAP